MARGSNLYRRGAVYWWRRRLSLAISENSTISLSLSLVTKELSVARARGSAMTIVSERIRMSVHQRITAGTITPGQAQAIANEEARAYRATLIMVDSSLVTEPEKMPVAPGRSLLCLAQFWSGAEQGGLAEAPDQEYADLHWPSLEPHERTALIALVKRSPVGIVLESDAIDRLVAVGLEPTPLNLAIAKRLIIRARAIVARDASAGDLMGDWLDSVSVSGAGEDVTVSELPAANAILPPWTEPPVMITPAAVDPFGNVSEENRRILAMTPIELADHYIEKKYGFLAHRGQGKRKASTTGEQTSRQIRCAARLIQQSVPAGTPFSLISGEQVKEFDRFLDRLPLSFGKSPKDHSFETTLLAVCERADAAVADGELDIERVGLEIPTTNKHFRYLQRLRDVIEEICPTLPRVRYGKYCQPDLKSTRDARVEYSIEQGVAIFSLPPWVGSLGLDDRLAPGDILIYDALYWVLLLVWYTGARREEICALRLADIRREFDIDYLQITEGKNANAIRRITIATELKRLRFLAYVDALREAGETLLFPEIEPGRSNGRLGDVFYKLWWIYLKPMLPSLVRGQAMQSCRHMVSTELKELQVFPESRNDLLGYAGDGGEGETRYAKATRLRRLQEVVDQIPVVTAHLAAFFGTIELLPPEDRKQRPTRDGGPWRNVK